MVVIEEEAPEGYQKFVDFDWSDEGWLAYLKNLYPPPDSKKIVKFKKKWYKKNVDPDFDETYEPPPPPTPPPPPPKSSPAASSSSVGGGSAYPPSAAAAGFLPPSAASDGTRWRKLGPKATICFVVYCLAITFSVAAAASAVPTYQALVVFSAAFILEILAKHGLKLNSEYFQAVLLDDVGVMPMMSLTLLTPGLHHGIRLLSLVAPFLTAVMSFAQICKYHKKVPKPMREFFEPLADTAARYKVMQVRAHAEVALGFALLAGGVSLQAAPISVLLFWNFMMMRYMMSPWTQASFRRIDKRLKPVLGKIPGISHGYNKLKNFLFSFVDPQSKRAGKLCTIL